MAHFIVLIIAITTIRAAWLRVFPAPIPAETTIGYDALSNTYTCVNAYGDEYVGTDAASCKDWEVSYPCKYGEDTYSVTNEAACKVKVAQLTKEDVAKFDPEAFAVNYRQASDAVIMLGKVR